MHYCENGDLIFTRIQRICAAFSPTVRAPAHKIKCTAQRVQRLRKTWRSHLHWKQSTHCDIHWFGWKNGQIRMGKYEWANTSGQIRVGKYEWANTSGQIRVGKYEWANTSGQIRVGKYEWANTCPFFYVFRNQSIIWWIQARSATLLKRLAGEINPCRLRVVATTWPDRQLLGCR